MAAKSLPSHKRAPSRGDHSHCLPWRLKLAWQYRIPSTQPNGSLCLGPQSQGNDNDTKCWDSRLLQALSMHYSLSNSHNYLTKQGQIRVDEEAVEEEKSEMGQVSHYTIRRSDSLLEALPKSGSIPRSQFHHLPGCVSMQLNHPSLSPPLCPRGLH